MKWHSSKQQSSGRPVARTEGQITGEKLGIRRINPGGKGLETIKKVKFCRKMWYTVDLRKQKTKNTSRSKTHS